MTWCKCVLWICLYYFKTIIVDVLECEQKMGSVLVSSLRHKFVVLSFDVHHFHSDITTASQRAKTVEWSEMESVRSHIYILFGYYVHNAVHTIPNASLDSRPMLLRTRTATS